MKHYYDAINADTTHKQGQMNGYVDFGLSESQIILY